MVNSYFPSFSWSEKIFQEFNYSSILSSASNDMFYLRHNLAGHFPLSIFEYDDAHIGKTHKNTGSLVHCRESISLPLLSSSKTYFLTASRQGIRFGRFVFIRSLKVFFLLTYQKNVKLGGKSYLFAPSLTEKV